MGSVFGNSPTPAFSTKQGKRVIQRCSKSTRLAVRKIDGVWSKPRHTLGNYFAGAAGLAITASLLRLGSGLRLRKRTHDDEPCVVVLGVAANGQDFALGQRLVHAVDLFTFAVEFHGHVVAALVLHLNRALSCS